MEEGEPWEREQRAPAQRSSEGKKEGLPQPCGLLMCQELELNLGVKTVGSNGASSSSLTNGSKVATLPRTSEPVIPCLHTTLYSPLPLWGVRPACVPLPQRTHSLQL